jgi:hypothetical protein
MAGGSLAERHNVHQRGAREHAIEILKIEMSESLRVSLNGDEHMTRVRCAAHADRALAQ